MNLETTPLENAHVQLNIVMPHDREKLAKEEIIQSMWTWLPVIGTGTNYDTYYDLIMKQAKDGDLIPFRITRRVDGAFAGLVGFEAISRTHRRLRIGYAFHPPEMRGTVISPATQLASAVSNTNCPN
jgi:hypothetical protein